MPQPPLTPSPAGPAESPAADCAACLSRGDLALFAEESAAALEWYARAGELEPDNPEPMLRAIETLLLLGELDEAGARLDRALAAAPEAPELQAARAVEWGRRGKPREGLDLLDRAQERTGETCAMLVARGHLLLAAGHPDAVPCFDAALKVSAGDDWRTPMFIGLLYRAHRRGSMAIDYFARAADRCPPNPLVWFQIGLCRAALGHRVLAAKAFQSARELCAGGDPLLAKIDRAASAPKSWLDRLLRRET